MERHMILDVVVDVTLSLLNLRLGIDDSLEQPLVFLVDFDSLISLEGLSGRSWMETMSYRRLGERRLPRVD